jgi:hypothetical protein
MAVVKVVVKLKTAETVKLIAIGGYQAANSSLVERQILTGFSVAGVTSGGTELVASVFVHVETDVDR